MGKIPFDISLDEKQSIDLPSTIEEKSTMNEQSFSKVSFIDEEALLPGALEPKEIKGYLDEIEYLVDNQGTIKFKPLVEQNQLINLQLTSLDQPLYYELNESQTELTAKQGANGPLVFSAYLDKNGQYKFTLYNHIDRKPQDNLIVNGSFENCQYIVNKGKQTLVTPGWEVLNHISEKETFTEYQQDIATEKDVLYQVTFYYSAHKSFESERHPIKVYWDESNIITLDPSHVDSHGYTFSVFGNPKKHSKLKFVCQDEDMVREFISNVSITSRAQSTVPIVLAFILMGSEDQIVESDIRVNVTTTPPLELNDHTPIDVVFEQSIYQTIVVNDESQSLDPFAKINLDSIFQTLDISKEDRLVQIVQLEADGLPTNVYEVQVSDKNLAFSPITVADVHLSFPGGDAGLSVFSKNIQIDEI